MKERPLYDRYYDPLWAAAQDLDVAVSLHGVQASYTAGMLANRYPANHVMGHVTGQPVERMLSLGEVLTGGVLARHPRLCFAFLEGNCSWLPWWLYALDEALVKNVIEEVGDENIVVSTDWPHDDSEYPVAVETFLGLAGTSDASKRRILWDNAARLYGLA